MIKTQNKCIQLDPKYFDVRNNVLFALFVFVLFSTVIFLKLGLDANTPPPAANPRSEQNTNMGSFKLWAL